MHKANLDRLAATGVPIQITELDLDGFDVNGVPGDEMQLAYYRRVVPTFWEHPLVEGITLWGWRQPTHWRNAQNAPIMLSNGTLKPAAHWLFNYVRGIAPVIRPDQSFTLGDGDANRVGTVQADDWASQIGRPNLRTFTWRITGGTDAGIFAIDAEHGRAAGRDSPAARRAHDLLAEGARERRLPRERRGRRHGRHRDLANVVDGDAGGTVPATLSLSLAGSAGFGAFTPGVAKDYEASVGATVISTRG